MVRISRRLAAVQTEFVLAGACTSCAVGNRARYLLLEEGESSTRRSRSFAGDPEVVRNRLWATSAPQIRWRWRHRAYFRVRIWIRSETAPGLDNLVNTLPFGAGHPEVTSPLLRRVARRHVDHDAFSTLPVRESSRQSPDGQPIFATFARSKLRLNRPPQGTAGLRRGRMMPVPPKRQARPGAGGSQASQVRPRCDLTSQAAVPARSGSRIRELQRTEVLLLL